LFVQLHFHVAIEINRSSVNSPLIHTINMASIYNTTGTTKMITNHPYYPLEVEIASYLANEWSVPILLSMFAGLCGMIFVGTVCVVDRVHKKLPATEKAAVWWFVLCAYIPQSLGCAN
jgi:H+/Cl- antiporter ClcA